MGKKLIIRGADFSENGISPDYQELAWIGSGATDTSIHILTGLTSDCKVIVTFDFFAAKVKNAPTATYPIGIVASGVYFTVAQVGSDVYGYYEGGSTYARVANTNIGNGNTTVVELSKLGVKVGTKALVAPNNPISTKYNIPYFGLDMGCNAVGKALAGAISADAADPAMRLRSVKIYADEADESSLIVDAIPVKRKEDGVVCLYNKVDGTYIERVDGTQPAYGELE